MSAPHRPSPVPSAWLSEFKSCLSLGWPLILTNAIEMVMNLTSLAMIGRLGPEALAASTLALALQNLCLLFGIGVTAAVAPMIARELGRDQDGASAVRRIVQQGFWAVAIIVGPIWIVLWNAEPLLIGLGQDPGLSAAAATYLRALQWTIFPALIYLVLRSCLAALGRPRWAVLTGSAAIALNAVLTWLLIGGHAGLPALGLFGSGLATLLSNVFMAAALAIVATRDPHVRGLRLFAGLFRPDWAGFPTFWRLGLPIGISLLLETGMFTVATVLVGRFDAASLAAHAIAIQVTTFTFMVPLGLAQAATIRIGRAAGAGDRAGVVRAGWTALAVGVAAMATAAAVLVAVPGLIIGLFIDGSDPGVATVETVGVTLLGLAGLFQIADGAQVVLAGMLRGLHDTRAPMVISAAGYWGIGLPLGALLAFVFGMRAPGVWIGMSAGLFTVAALLLARWQSLLQRRSLPAAAT